MNPELFETRFNLAGEPIDNSITPEGEARLRTLAENEARKAQKVFFDLPDGEIDWSYLDSL